jgi:hypothetical protein
MPTCSKFHSLPRRMPRWYSPVFEKSFAKPCASVMQRSCSIVELILPTAGAISVICDGEVVPVRPANSFLVGCCNFHCYLVTLLETSLALVEAFSMPNLDWAKCLLTWFGLADRDTSALSRSDSDMASYVPRVLISHQFYEPSHGWRLT